MLVAHPSLMPIRRRLDVIRTRWHKLIATACDPYRPELHYMRGPGPRWHARHHDRTESCVP
jgi:hypothetical protein